MFKQIFNLFKSDSLYKQALEECHEMLDIDLRMFQESINVLRNKAVSYTHLTLPTNREV